MRIGPMGFLERRTSRGKLGGEVYRNWWLVNESGKVSVNQIQLPRKYIGKRVRMKLTVEELE